MCVSHTKYEVSDYLQQRYERQRQM